MLGGFVATVTPVTAGGVERVVEVDEPPPPQLPKNMSEAKETMTAMPCAHKEERAGKDSLLPSVRYSAREYREIESLTSQLLYQAFKQACAFPSPIFTRKEASLPSLSHFLCSSCY